MVKLSETILTFCLRMFYLFLCDAGTSTTRRLRWCRPKGRVGAQGGNSNFFFFFLMGRMPKRILFPL